MSENDRLQNHEEKKRLEERASAAAARKMDDKIIGEFLTKFEKDYRANINERKKGSK